MNRILVFSLLCIFLSNTALGQLDLPMPSPKGKVEQTVGLTKIEINYSRPAVKGRKIWGDLVPYNQAWRTGANDATEISFSDEVEINGLKLKKGDYAIFTLPGEKEWTIMINSNEGQKGSSTHKPELDLVKIKVKPEVSCEHKERLEFTINPVSDEEGEVVMHWEKLKVSFAVKTFPLKAAEKKIRKFAEESSGLWYDLARAANYSSENNLNSDKVNSWIDQSIALKDHFFNKYIKAKILFKEGKKEEAVKLASAAKEFGEKNPSGFYNAYKEAIEKSLNDWK